MPRVVIIAGEASGDLLGAGLVKALQRRNPRIEINGVAGPAMRAAGCNTWHDCEQLAVMGLFEVLRHLPRIWAVMHDLKRRIQESPPDLIIGIDAPDFNLRLERWARRRGIPTVHYVSPSVWAWRQSRVHTIRSACDRVLCLLPFEADFLQKHGVHADFVGHPLADEIADPGPSRAVADDLGCGPGRVVAILPGSRRGEVAMLAPAFAAAASWLWQRQPALEFLIPCATPAIRTMIEACWHQHGPALAPLRIMDGQSRRCMAAADVVLLASGTATLEAMLLRRPMVVAYRVGALTALVARALRLIKVRFFSLPNLIANEALVPELLQEQVTPENLGSAVLDWLSDHEKSERIRLRFASLREVLRRDASERAADVVTEMLGVRPGG